MNPTTQFEDRSFSLAPFVFTLLAGETLDNQYITMDRDADFFWCNTLAVTTNLPFGFKFQDTSLNYLSNDYVGSFVFAAQWGVGQPYVQIPHIFCPAGSSVRLSLIELSGFTNGPNQIILQGFKRFYR